MPRPKSIDRDRVLDAAEQIVIEKGAAALSIGTVAAAAGVSKGGIQSSFGSKQDLIEAMLDRWLSYDDSLHARLAGENPDAQQSGAAHITSTRMMAEASQSRITALATAWIQSPRHLSDARAWYAGRIGDLQASTPAQRQRRLALLAGKGAYYLRYLGLTAIDDAMWADIFDDIEALFAAARET